MRRSEIPGELTVAYGGDRGHERIAIGVVAIGRPWRNARTTRHGAERQGGRAIFLEQLHCRAQACGRQIAVVVLVPRCWHDHTRLM